MVAKIYKNIKEFRNRPDDESHVNGYTLEWLNENDLTLEQAEKSNVKSFGCFNCYDCNYCICCEECLKCAHCTYCKDCFNCSDCRQCEGCKYCLNCELCVDAVDSARERGKGFHRNI